MTAYNPSEAARLAELMRRAAGSVIPGGCGVYGDNLRSAADQLEAAGREMERLTHELDLMTKKRDAKVGSMVELCGDVGRAKSAGNDMCSTIERINAERDSLRVEVERYRQGCERADKAYSIQREARKTAERESNSLLHQLEAAQREKAETTTDMITADRRANALELDIQRLSVAIAAAQRRIAELEAAKRAHADDLEMFRATESDLASHRRRADATEVDLAAAQRRISELMVALDDAIQHDDDAAALRAIFPVYRAVVEWARESELVKAGVGGSIDRCFKLEEQVEAWILRARAALTPDILATLKAAGLEMP